MLIFAQSFHGLLCKVTNRCVHMYSDLVFFSLMVLGPWPLTCGYSSVAQVAWLNIHDQSFKGLTSPLAHTLSLSTQGVVYIFKLVLIHSEDYFFIFFRILCYKVWGVWIWWSVVTLTFQLMNWARCQSKDDDVKVKVDIMFVALMQSFFLMNKNLHWTHCNFCSSYSIFQFWNNYCYSQLLFIWGNS